MNKIPVYTNLVGFLFLLSTLSLQSIKPHFVVLITSYKNINYYEKNLDSLVEQDYNNWNAIYVDDASSDGTGKAVKQYIQKNSLQNKIKLVINNTNKGKMENMYHTIHALSDLDVVVVLDGDDWFSTQHALSRIAKEYDSNDAWVTYGNYSTTDNTNIPIVSDAHKEICDGTFRLNCMNTETFHGVPAGHPFTFYAYLFKKIQLQDMLLYGKFAEAASDGSYVPPILEMAEHHAKFIPEILYHHNMDNENRDIKVNTAIQQAGIFVFYNCPPYKAIDIIPLDSEITPTITAILLYCNGENFVNFYKNLKTKISFAQNTLETHVIYSNANLGTTKYRENQDKKKLKILYKKLESEPSKAMKQFIELVGSISTDYVLIMSNPNELITPIDLEKYMSKMNQTKAHAFYIGEGLFEKCKTHTQLNNIGDECFALQIPNYGYLHEELRACRIVLYNRNELLNQLKSTQFIPFEAKYLPNAIRLLDLPHKAIGLVEEK